MMDKHMEVLMNCVDFLKEKGYEVIYVALYGSQNYKMDTPTSDHDFKAVVMPSLNDVALAKNPVSKTLEFGDGLVDVKDVRCMIDCWKKQNPNFMELLFTKWFWVNPAYEAFLWFRENAERIAHADEGRAITAMLGMMKEKQHALRHDYPAQHDVIEKYGYAAKQLSHVLRLRLMMEEFFEKDYSEILVPSETAAHGMVACKSYEIVYSPEFAQLLADENVDAAEKFKEDHQASLKPKDEEVLKEMDAMKYELIKSGLRRELLS